MRSKNKTKNRLVKPLDICISFYAQSSVTRVPARACRPARAAAGGHAPCPKPCPCRRAAAVMRQDVMPSWLMRQQLKKKQKLGGLRWRCPLRPAPLVRRRASRLERSMIHISHRINVTCTALAAEERCTVAPRRRRSLVLSARTTGPGPNSGERWGIGAPFPLACPVASVPCAYCASRFCCII